jgi:multidrug resistance efflux pump
VISGEAVEETRLGAEAARAALIRASTSASAARAESDARQAKARADVAVTVARLRVAQADARRMATLLGYAKLRAPFTGVVTCRKVDSGHFLQSSTAGPKGEPVFVVARADPVRIFVDVPENDAVLVGDGTRAVVRVQALRGRSSGAR